MGVWIETAMAARLSKAGRVTPCMGVWIETFAEGIAADDLVSHPVWVCGLKQIMDVLWNTLQESHPVWVCGLKLHSFTIERPKRRSHPVWVCGLKLLNRSI